MRGVAWVAAGLALALAGCAVRKPVSLPPAPVERPPPPAVAALSPASYLELAASSALWSLRAAELALQRARDPQLRRFAAASVIAQRGIGAQLSFAGRRLNLLPPAMLMAGHQARFDELAATDDFDGVYRGHQRAIAIAAHRAHRDFAERGASPTLRPVARMAEAVLRRHLALLEGR